MYLTSKRFGLKYLTIIDKKMRFLSGIKKKVSFNIVNKSALFLKRI